MEGYCLRLSFNPKEEDPRKREAAARRIKRMLENILQADPDIEVTEAILVRQERVLSVVV